MACNNVLENDSSSSPPLPPTAARPFEDTKVIYDSMRARLSTSEEICRELIRVEAPFSHVVRLGDLALAKTMLENGADVNDCSDDMGASALHLATFSRNANFVELLLEQQAVDVNSITTCEFTPLDMLFVAESDWTVDCNRIARLLVSRGANFKSAPLCLALVRCDLKTIEFFLAHTEDESLRDVCLDCAALNRLDPYVLEFAMDSRNVQAMNEATLRNELAAPLVYAAKDKNVEAVKKLLRRGADYRDYAFAKDGRSPLSWLVDDEKCASVAWTFFEHGLNVMAGGKDENLLCLRMIRNSDGAWARNIVAEIAKLEATGAPRRDAIRRILKRNDRLAALLDTCNEELGIMKSLTFYEHLTFFDVLVANVSRLSGYSRNRDLVRAFEDSRYDTSFPNYCERVRDRFGYEIWKQSFFLSSIDVLRDTLRTFQVCDDVLEKIVYYLTGSDMRVLLSDRE